MRIYNSPQTSPTPSKKISNDGPSNNKSTTPKKLSLLQEKMLAYQNKAAEAEEVYTPTSHARRDTYQNANIDLKDRMSKWEKQPEPEIEQPVFEDVAVEEEEIVVEEEPLSLADRMAKYKAQSAPDKFTKTKAQQEIDEAKRMKEEEELRLKKEEEERLKPKMVKVASRRASSEIQKRMAAWGEKVDEEPEVPAPIVEESVMEEDKEDESENNMDPDTSIVNDEPEPESPRQAPYKRPADMPETSNLLKERMACWGGGAKEKEEEHSAEEVSTEKKEEVDVVDEIAARVAEMTEDKPPTDELPPTANDEPKPQAAPRTTPRKSALLEAKLNAYTQATDENIDPSPYKKKPIDMPDVPKLNDKLSAYTKAGTLPDDTDSTPKKKKPIDMPVTPNSSLRDKMNAYKAGSTREFGRSAGATDLDPELSSSVLKSRMEAWEQGQVGDEEDKDEDDHVKEAELAHLLCSGALKEKMSEYTKAGAAHEQTEASAPTDLPPELSQNLLKNKLIAYKQVVSTPTEDGHEDAITKNVDVDEDTAALLSSAMALANEKRKHELLEIMRDRTLSKEARAERIYEKISCIRADDIIIDGETIETEEGSHQDIEDF